MVGVEQADNVEAEIALEPDDVALSAVQDFDDARVGEDLVELDERVADGRHERVDRVVIRAALPKTMIGKLSRKDLLAEIAAERAEQAGAG